MVEAQKPSLRLVGGNDLDDVFDDDPATDPLDPANTPSGRKTRRRIARSKRWTRTWLAWLANERWQHVFPPLARLWLVLWYRSYEGREPLQITQKIAKEAYIPLQHRDRYARRLEQLGLVRIERHGQQLLRLTILVPPPNGHRS